MDKTKDFTSERRSGMLVLGGIVFFAISGAVTLAVVVPVFTSHMTDLMSFILSIFLWLFLCAVAFVSLMVHLKNRNILPSLWRNLRPFRTIHFMLMVCLGLIVSNNFDFLVANNVPFIVIAVLLLVFIWKYTVMVNDIYDQKIDELSNIDRPLIAGVVTKDQYFNLIVCVAVFSGIFGFVLGPLILFITIICLFLGTIYSIPPIRVRDRIWSSVIIGLGSAFAFLIGFFTPNFEGVQASLTMDAVLIALIIFSALSMGPVLTDLKDYEGDKRAKVRSLYTVIGLESGRKTASALIPVMFIIPAIILHNLLDLITFIVFGAIATVIFYKKGDYRGVFLCYFVVIMYCITRIAGFLTGHL